MASRTVQRTNWWCEYPGCDETLDTETEALPTGWVEFSGSSFCSAGHLVRHVLALTPAFGDGTMHPTRRSMGSVLPEYLRRPLVAAVMKAPKGVKADARDARIVELGLEELRHWMTLGQKPAVEATRAPQA